MSDTEIGGATGNDDESVGEEHEEAMDDNKEAVKSRKSRNLSEKKRRDQFNMLINELYSVVATSNRKMDKITILKTTIAFLKHHNEITQQSHVHEIKEDWKPSFLSNDEFAQLVLESLESLVMVVTQSGTILYTSESITQLLSYLPNDLENRLLYDIVHPDDRVKVKNILTGHTFVPGNGGPDFKKVENQIAFSCHLKCGSMVQKEAAVYELVEFNGYLRKWSPGIFLTADDEEEADMFLGGALPTEEICYCCTVKIKASQLIRELAVIDENKKEFTSRHSMEWKFLFLDHRGPTIVGYLPFEVLGTSGYDYYHPEDLEAVVKCHEQLMLSGEGTSCYYRFLTKGQQWIWLQTHYYITYHQWNSKPEFIVCTNTAVSYSEVRAARRLDDSKEKVEETKVDDQEKVCRVAGTTSDEGPADTSESSWTKGASMASTSSAMRMKSEPGLSSEQQKNKNTSTASQCTTSSSSQGFTWTPQPKASTSAAGLRDSQNRGRQQQQQQQQAGSSKDFPMSGQTGGGGQQDARPGTASSSLQQQQPETSTVLLMPQPGVMQNVPTVQVQQPQQASFYLTQAQQQLQQQLQQKHAQLQESILRQQQELQQIWEQLMITSRLSFPLVQQQTSAPQSPLASAEMVQAPLNQGSVVIQCMSGPLTPVQSPAVSQQARQDSTNVPEPPFMPLPLFPLQPQQQQQQQQQHVPPVVSNPVLPSLMENSPHAVASPNSPALSVLSPCVEQTGTLELVAASPANMYNQLLLDGQPVVSHSTVNTSGLHQQASQVLHQSPIVMSPNQMSPGVQSPMLTSAVMNSPSADQPGSRSFSTQPSPSVTQSSPLPPPH